MDQIDEQTVDNEIPSTEAEVDELLLKIEGETSPDGPIQDASAQAKPTWDGKEWTFKVGGKDVIPTDKHQILTWAQLGYGANHKIAELNKEIMSWKQKEAQIKELEGRYGEVDKYVKENPKFWEHVLQTYQRREQMENPNDPVVQTLQELKAKTQQYDQYIEQMQQREAQERMKKEDQEYINHLSEMKKSYPMIDFDAPDENGKSLEHRTLEYAIQNGIRNFKTAFRDYYHDELVKIGAEQAKEKVAKTKFNMQKDGVIGVTERPTKRMSEDVKNKTWNQLAEEAISEMQAGRV